MDEKPSFGPDVGIFVCRRKVRLISKLSSISAKIQDRKIIKQILKKDRKTIDIRFKNIVIPFIESNCAPIHIYPYLS